MIASPVLFPTSKWDQVSLKSVDNSELTHPVVRKEKRGGQHLFNVTLARPSITV